MVDIFTKEQRSYYMSRVRSKNTKPELLLRKLLFSKGIKGYRVNANLPGKPDIVFTKYKLTIFIDGCFWHKCPNCFSPPQTNKEFWMKKIDGNVERDKKINKILSESGYTVIRFWEHEIEYDLNNCYDIIYKTLIEKGFKAEITIKYPKGSE